ncbi:hypothetical protein IAR55_006980 [Kwoniella newhampshirensis]|uniref:NuA3 HAT complex component NTO1 n=1 Tax=Kwoniella newhampshirensis TaxID=1651941 RepID=A0AAW0YT20_9TREE
MPLETNADKAYMHDLPKVSFRIVTGDKSALQPAGVQSEQSRSYGYNDFSDFERPEHYIRYIEPIESELAIQVEYDMDEQDQEWLDAINAERKKDQSGPISYEVFEIIMDKLEKEWFILSKKIPQPAQHLPAEDSKCAVCDDGEGENSNAIVFCDGCNLAVHQDCYGVPYIPEGQWLCRKCTVSPENPVSCIFCPNEGGAFKQTTTGHWSHLLCAIWIPETGLGNAIYMEPVEGVETVPKNRWKLVCSLCRERQGACIQCDNKNCFTAFHVTCARQVGLLQSMKSLNTDGVLKAYCSKHLPAGTPAYEDSETASNFSSSEPPTTKKERHTSGPIIIPVTKKSAQAHSKSFRPGPPIVPKIIVDKLLEYVAKIAIRKRHPFVERLCRYWSLKREARRGAPLLKRLYLEPWTASSSLRQQTEAEKAQKLKFLQMLRNDLEKVRMLAELVRKREKEKLRQAQIVKDIVDNFIFPHHGKLRLTLEKISAMDRQELYLNPVSRAEASDYFDVIKEPMCWLFIDEKLDKNEYLDVADFKRDVRLVLDNAMLYNPKDNLFHKSAARIKKNAEPLLEELDVISTAYPDETGIDTSESKYGPSHIGDLEPTTILLQALLHGDSNANADRQDLLASIFAFELEKPKEPTPPPTPKPPRAPRKSITGAEKRKRWEEREAAAKERAAARATRATKAMVKAFAEEAGIPGSSDAEASGLSVRPTPERDVRSRRRSMRNPAAAGVASISTVAEESGMPTVASTSASGGGSGSASPTKRSGTGSGSTVRPTSRPQRGVVGLETIQVLTDRERREQEKRLDIITQQVDPQDQFKRFNVGWVLPEGSKRRRSERPSEPAHSRPPNSQSRRKSASASVKPISAGSRSSKTTVVKHERESMKPMTPMVTRVRLESESGSELSSAPPTSAVNSAAPSPRKSARARKSPAGPSRLPVASPSFGSRAGQKRKGEEASTPRESKRAKKSMKRSTAVEKPDDDEEMTPIPSDVEMNEQDPISEEEQEEVEHREQEKDEGEKVEHVQVEKKGKGRTKQNDMENQAAEDQEDDPYPPGTLVFTFPYFPAEIVDPAEAREDGINPDLMKKEDEERAKAKARGSRVWLVNFFDNGRTWGWVHEDRVNRLNEDEALDAMYLAGHEKNKKKGFKSSSTKQAVRKGYREALASLVSEPEEGGDEVVEGE